MTHDTTAGHPATPEDPEFDGHIRSRPVSWIVITAVTVGFAVAGAGIVAATPWVFFLGVGIVVLFTLVGWATHAMADPRRLAEKRAGRISGPPVGELAAPTTTDLPSPEAGPAEHVWP